MEEWREALDVHMVDVGMEGGFGRAHWWMGEWRVALDVVDGVIKVSLDVVDDG